MRKVLNWNRLTDERKATTLAYLAACRVLRQAGALPTAARKRGDDQAG